MKFEDVLRDCEDMFKSASDGDRVPGRRYSELIEAFLENIANCEPAVRERTVIVLNEFFSCRELDGDALLETIGSEPSFWHHRALASCKWMKGDNGGAAKEFESAYAFADSVSPDVLIDAVCDAALAVWQNGNLDAAERWLEIAEQIDASTGMSEVVRVYRFLFSLDEFDPEQVPEIVENLATAPMFVRISALYQLTYSSEHYLGPHQRAEFCNEIFQLANRSGHPWYRYLAGTRLTANLRTLGRYREGLEVLETLAPLLRESAGFFSPMWFDSERGFFHMHAGEFDQAQIYFASVIEDRAASDDLASFSNLLSIRAAVWLAQGQRETAEVAIETACEIAVDRTDTGGRVIPAVRAIVEAAAGRFDAAIPFLNQIMKLWGGSDDPAAKTIAHAMSGAIRKSKEDIATARKTGLVTGPQFLALVDACEWIAFGERTEESWKKSCEVPMLLGTLIGIAVAGWSRILISEKTKLVSIEDGVFIVDGSVVDLRRRKTLLGIVTTLRGSPQKTFNVEEIFREAWNETVVPTTVENRVYFAIYELRRLGFKSFIETNDNGYRWAEN